MSLQQKNGKPDKDELRVGIGSIVYHREYGVLCQGIKESGGMAFHAIQFKDNAAAWRWIEDGCIAEVQEGTSNLAVSFSTVLWSPTKYPH